MSEQRSEQGSSPTAVITALRELIDALDRRVPHIDRVGEVQIAKDAAKLRREAVNRIEELTRAEADHQTHDQELVDGIMSDDAGPARKE